MNQRPIQRMKTTIVTPEKSIEPAQVNFMQSFKRKLIKGLTQDNINFKLQGRKGKTATKASFTLDQLEVLRKLRIRMRKLFIKKTEIIQTTAYDRLIFDNMDTFEKVQEDINIDWNERKKIIMENFKISSESIQRNSPKVQYFHVDEYSSDKDSVGSVSCGDEGDIEIVLNGEHRHFFQAFKLIRKFDLMKEKQIQNLEEKNSLGTQIMEKLCCRKKPDKKDKLSVLQDQLKIQIKQKVHDHKQGPVEFKGIQMIGIREKRTGRQLWRIARNLVIKPKTRWSQLINQSVKCSDRIKQQQEFEDKQQMEQLVLQDGKDDNQVENRDHADNEQLIEFGQKGYIDQCIKKFINMYHEKLIEPTNKKLQYFHIIVSVTLFYDFFLTGLIMGNYPFYLGQVDDFSDHVSQYQMICFIQIVDIILNFFKIEEGQSRKKVANPMEIFNQYFRGNFMIDFVAVIPYTMFNVYLIPLRYLKLIKFNIYLNYLQIYIFENFLVCFNQEQNKIVMSMLRLLIQVIVVSHFFACIWALIGQYNLEHYQTGWIHLAMENEYQTNSYWSIYLTAFYWVITTFTSVGYGDILGVTNTENLYGMVVEMVGIGFFGYIVGTFQNLISSFGVTDQLTELMEKIDQNLMKLDKTVKDRVLIPSIYQGVKEFTELKYKNDAIDVQEQEYFQMLKPRLQRELLDLIFDSYYQLFNWIFEETDAAETNFKRDIFSNCKFFYCPKFNEDDNEHIATSWANLDQVPSIIEAGQFSKYVYFILQGQINIMSKDGLFDYGQLNEGSYFGDISILLNQPNQFSYFYDPFQERPTLLLQIRVEEFIRICGLNPLSHAEMKYKAEQRQEMFNMYKTQMLIKFMKTIKKDPQIATPKFFKNQHDVFQKVKKMQYFNDKLVLVELLIEQYELKRMHAKIKKMEIDYQKEEGIEKKKKQIIQQYDQNEYFIVNYEEIDKQENCVQPSKLLHEIRKMTPGQNNEDQEEQARIHCDIYHQEPQLQTQQTKNFMKDIKVKIAKGIEDRKNQQNEKYKELEELKRKMLEEEKEEEFKFELHEGEPLRTSNLQEQILLQESIQSRRMTASQMKENFITKKKEEKQKQNEFQEDQMSLNQSSLHMTEKLESKDHDHIGEQRQIEIIVQEASPNQTIFNASSNQSNQTENGANQSPNLIEQRERAVVTTPSLQIPKLEATRPQNKVNFQDQQIFQNTRLPKIELDEVQVEFQKYQTSMKWFKEEEKISSEQLQQNLKEQQLQVKQLQKKNQIFQTQRQTSPSLVPQILKRNMRPKRRVVFQEELFPQQRRFTIVPREQYLAQRQQNDNQAQPEQDESPVTPKSKRTRTQRGFQSRQNKKPKTQIEQDQRLEEIKNSDIINHEGGTQEGQTPKFGRLPKKSSQRQPSMKQSNKSIIAGKKQSDVTSNYSKSSYMSKDYPTIDWQRAIEDNKHNIKRALTKYFLRKGITEIKRERLRENDLKRKKELQEFRQENEIPEDVDDQSCASQQHLENELGICLEHKQEMLINPLKYLDQVIDEFIDLILVDHNLQKKKNEEGKQILNEFPPKPLDSLKQSRQNHLNSNSEQDVQDFDRKYHSQSLFKILLIRDLFKNKYGDFDESYAFFAQSIQRQVQANQCFKTLFDGSMTDLNDTFKSMKDNINTKMHNLVAIQNDTINERTFD